MKTMVCALVLAAVLVVANCATSQIVYLVPEDAPLVRVARSPQFSSARASARSYSRSSSYGGFSRASASASASSSSGGYRNSPYRTVFYF
uniref:Uncharacterized protein n=1 Tax=Anopheles atroparvus TaxID=41427 RepID=A0AAG5D2V9_ANOAO